MTGLAARLADHEVILIDGATGTELEVAGVPMDGAAWCGLASMTHPEVVKQVHVDNIGAGAELIIANTFVCSRHILERAGQAHEFEALNRIGIELAIEARHTAAKPGVVVAGSISTTQQGAEHPSPAVATANFADQVSVQVAAGAEMFVLEMMRDLEQTRIALDAVLSTGLPVWLGWTCTMIDGEPWLYNGGHRLADGMEMIKDDNIELVAIMHTEVDHVDACLDVVQAHWSGPTGVYSQTGDWVQPNWIFLDTISPEDYTAACLRWVDRGVQAIGGCCGIRPAHIEHLQNHLPAKITEI